jgi:hypothetical protein
MNPYGALRDQEGSGARISSIRSAAVVGSLAPFGCMSGLRLAGRSSGPVSVWIRRRMPVDEMCELLFCWLRHA